MIAGWQRQIKNKNCLQISLKWDRPPIEAWRACWGFLQSTAQHSINVVLWKPLSFLLLIWKSTQGIFHSITCEKNKQKMHVFFVHWYCWNNSAPLNWSGSFYYCYEVIVFLPSDNRHLLSWHIQRLFCMVRAGHDRRRCSQLCICSL